MLSLILLSWAALSPAATTRSALALCRPALAAKAGGDIQSIAVSSSHSHGRDRTLVGTMTLFVGAASPVLGSAATHHLIRANFDYRCSVRGTAVRSVSVRSVP